MSSMKSEMGSLGVTVRPPGNALGWLLAVIVAVAMLGGLASLRGPLATLSPTYLYGKNALKDFVQEYLLAKAVADGTDPYLPVNVLAARYLGISLDGVYPHPSPHPPPVALLSLPLSALEYPTAAAIWLGVELACLLAAVYLLLRTAGLQPAALPSVAIAVASLAWFPMTDELLLGQLMLPLLLILAAARLALLLGRPILGGTLLGCTMLIKPLTWPVFFVFVVRREWRGLAAAAWAIFLGYTAACWAMGRNESWPTPPGSCPRPLTLSGALTPASRPGVLAGDSSTAPGRRCRSTPGSPPPRSSSRRLPPGPWRPACRP